MKKGRFESSASAKKHTKKVVALLLVMLLLVGSVIGTTLAWLTDTVETVQDTFTIGAVEIYLNKGATGENESWSEGTRDKDHPMVPGVADSQIDPYVKVAATSQVCWLFVEVEASADLAFEIAEGWTPISGNVYGRQVTDVATANYQIIKNNTVTPDDDATTNLTLDITAYAIQSEGLVDGESAPVTTVAKAWEVSGFGTQQP